MTREVAHQKSFEKALYSIQPNFPPGKLPGKREFANVYFDMSQTALPGEEGGEDEALRGPWNSGPDWEFVDARADQVAVNGGDGDASVKLTAAERKPLEQFAARTASAPDSDPTTGVDLGAGPGTGKTKATREDASARPSRPPPKPKK